MRLNLKKLGPGLVTVVAAAMLVFAYRGNSRDRYDGARARLSHDCARWKERGGESNVCDLDARSTGMFPLYKDARSQVVLARAAFERDDDPAATEELGRALDAVAEMDRRGTLVAEMMAATVLGEALAVIEAAQAKASSPRRASLLASVLAGRRLRSTAHPLEGERLLVQSALVSLPSGRQGPKPFLNAYLADAMEEEDALTAGMERAIARGDTQGCSLAAKRRSAVTARYGMGMAETVCTKMVGFVQAGKRLDRLRDTTARAALRSSVVRPERPGGPARIAQVDR
jgi:hypothetical protein